MKKILLLMVTILFLMFLFYTFNINMGLGTIGNYKFNYSKIYVAPKSKLKIRVTTSGYVPNGNDLGNGKSDVKLFSNTIKSDTVYLKTSPENIYSVSYQKNSVFFFCNQMEKRKLYDFLVSIGFKNLDKNEIDELRDAMTFINYGPKAILLKGQTKFIQVEN